MRKYRAPTTEFFCLPNNIFTVPMTATEFWLYAYLVCRAGSKGYCWPTLDRIIRDTGIKKTSLQNAIGQVSQVTPMQLAAYCMMIANNGVRYKTHLLYSLRGYDGVSEKVYEPEVAASVRWDEKAIAAVKAGMLECVKTGTAAKYFEGITYTLAAKTGTAQTGVSTWSDHGCFIGYAPADDPEVAIAVVMERGKSAAASQVARVVLDAYFEMRSGVNKPDDIGSLLP